MELNTATFEEMQRLAGVSHGRAQAILIKRININHELHLCVDREKEMRNPSLSCVFGLTKMEGRL